MLQLLNLSIKALSYIELKLNKNNNPNPLGYEDLTPTTNVDEDKKYSDALEWALKNDNIKNIALTGSHGSGKSSVIKSFINEHRGYNILNISLASFSDKKDNPKINRLLELSILQQMFYHVKHNKIPDSRFKRIHNLKVKSIILKSLLLITWLLSIVIFFEVECVTTSFLWEEWKLDNNKTVSIVALCVSLLGLFCAVYKAIRVCNNSKLNKLNVQSGEIEIGKKVDSSILNKHLDEILYFFEVSRFDIVIFEDLDRFENTEIFTKLRELNILVNHSKQINKRIVFLYAIKDDMFQDQNRTKFFDFIIPIIPVVNISNSGAKLIGKFKEAKLINEDPKDSLSEDFISDVSMYIDDMRLLKNIYNEYVTYKAKLDTKLTPDNLLAMIIYKNIFPSDFVDLHNDKGKVFSIFNKKTELIRGKIDEISEEVKTLRIGIQEIESITVKNIQELRAIYIEAIIGEVPKAEAIIINDATCTFKELKGDENFSLIIESANIKYLTYGLDSRRQYVHVNADSTLSFKDIENIVDTEYTYLEREDLIIQRDDNKVESLKQKLEELEKEKLDIKSWSLSQLAEKVEITTVFNEIENEKLIIYLILNGYLNEDYHDYISYFYDAIITKEDRKFLFSIKTRNALNSKFKLTKIENLIKKIKPKEFGHEESLNCNLLDFLLENKGKYKEKYGNLLSQICNKSEVSLLFIDQFFGNGINVDIFLKEICSKYHFWGYLMTTVLPDKTKDGYLKEFITRLDVDVLKAQNTENSLSDYIAKKNDFLSFISGIGAEKINPILKELNVKFISLEKPIDGGRVFDFIYQNDLYKINTDMIHLMLAENGTDNNLSSLESANYTTIMSSGCAPLLKYINSNIQEYISSVFSQLENNKKESEDTIILMINNEDIKIEDRKKIIDISENKIQVLSTIKDRGLVEHLLETSKVTASWGNVAHYYRLIDLSYDDLGDYTIDPINKILSSFINNFDNYSELSKIKLKEGLGDENPLVSKLAQSLIINDDIEDVCFESILRCCPYMYAPLDFADLSKRKIELLIQDGYLGLSLDRYNYIKEHFIGLHIKLLTKYAKDLIESDEDYSFDENDLLVLFASGEIGLTQKIKIVLISDKDVIINNKELCSEVCNYLSIYKYVELDYKLLLGIITNAQSLEDRIRLLNIHFDYLSEDNIGELLTSLGYPYSDIAVRGRRPSLPLNDATLVLVEKLEKMSYISTSSKTDSKIKINTKK